MKRIFLYNAASGFIVAIAIRNLLNNWNNLPVKFPFLGFNLPKFILWLFPFVMIILTVLLFLPVPLKLEKKFAERKKTNDLFKEIVASFVLCCELLLFFLLKFVLQIVSKTFASDPMWFKLNLIFILVLIFFNAMYYRQKWKELSSKDLNQNNN